MKSQKRNRDLVGIIARSAAAALVLAAGGSAMAAYTGTTTFQEVNPAGGPYPLDDPANWTNGLPTANTLAILANANTAPPAISTTPMTAYALEYGNTAFNLTIGGQPITLTSTDSVIDTTAMTSPALHYASQGVGEFQINNKLILGDGSVPTGTAYFANTGTGRLLVGGPIAQAAGTTWGLTLLPSAQQYRFRAGTNSGNYLTNRYTFTGPVTVSNGASVRQFNNVVPYGTGLPNMTIDGQWFHSANNGTIIVNAIDGASTGIIGRNGGNDVAIGANGANGTFAGAINNSSTRLTKLGGGVQTLNNAANAYSSLALVGGVVSVDSIANAGFNSAAGRGSGEGSISGGTIPLAGTTFDGGTLQYTGGTTTSDRVIDVGFRGGTIDASGTGALQLSGAVNSTDLARAYGDNVESGTSQFVTNMYGLDGLSAIASQLKIVDLTAYNSADFGGHGLTNAIGTSPVSIDEVARTMELAPGAANNIPGNGSGAPRIMFQSTTGLERTLNLTGTNTGDNTIGGALADSAQGGKLNINKTGAGTWVLSGANTYTGVTAVNGGTLGMTASAIPAGNAITVNSGATWEGRGPGTAITAHNLTVNSGGRAALESTGTGTIVLRSDNFALNGTAKLDLRDNKLITSKPVGTASGGVYTEGSVQRMVQTAYAEGSWSGPGITTSMADAKSGLTTIAVATAGQLDMTTFAGQPVAPTDTIAFYTYGGDSNFDGKIDADDYGSIDFNILVPGASGYANGDFNYDGVINADDYGSIDFNILAQGAPFSTTGAAAAAGLSGVSAVPEPASLAVVGLAAASLLGRRRRRQH